ncbi:MAG: hypothetical protein B6I22_07355, partial [Desulfobacteraceae bacterium 4572_123]
MEKVAYVLFLAAMVISPLIFGAMHPWAYTLMSLLVFVGTVLLLPGRIAREPGKNGFFIKIPNTGLKFFFIVFLLLLIFQLTPLPEGVVNFLSPQRVKVAKASLAGLETSTVSPNGRWLSLCVYQHPVRMSLIRFFTYALFFYGMLLVLNSRQRIETTVFLVLILCCFETVYGLAQTYSGSGHILWYAKNSYGRDVSGTYINRNHLAGLLSMGLLTAAAYAAALARPKRERPKGLPGKGDIKSRIFGGLSGGEAPGKRLLVFFCGVIIGIGLIFTASRGGMIAGACGLFCMGLIFIFRRAQRRKGVALLGLFLVTAGYAVYIGAEYPMGRFNYFDQSLENRTRYARKTMDIYQDYPVAGIGFGNFEYVYPGYQAAKDNKRYIRFAHNDWAQFLAETGTIGPILLLTGMACFLFRTLRLWLKRHDPFALGLGTLAPAIIGTMAIHSYSDFNLHIPANFLMLTGLTACSSAALHLHCRRGRENLVFRWHCLPLKFRGTVFLFLLVGMMIWCAGGALRHFGAESNCATVHNATFNIDRQPSLENIRRAISRDSLNARYRQKLARALMKDRDDHAAEDNYQENLVRVAGIIAALQDVILLNPCETESYIRLAREYTYLWQEPNYREKWLPAADRAMESAAFFVGEKNPRQHVEMGHYWNMRAGHPW